VIDPAAWFGAYLAPVPLAGETLRFDLSPFRSRVTREMLQARLRRTPQAFGAGVRPLAANITLDETALEVQASALMAANAVVTERLLEGPAGAVDALRRLAAAAVRLDSAARRFAGAVSSGQCPSPAALVSYLAASAEDQALGALKFCLPADLRPRLAPWFDEDPDLLEALLSPTRRSLFSALQAQALALAAGRLHGPPAVYFARLRRFRRAWGYLHGEDVDFAAAESEAAIDAHAAELGAKGARELKAQQQRLREALRTDQRRKLRARRIFAERLAVGAGGDRAARLVSHVLLARTLSAHEDHNRQRKMRLLRDLRDLAQLARLRLETASLRDFADACGAFTGADPLLASAAS